VCAVSTGGSISCGRATSRRGAQGTERPSERAAEMRVERGRKRPGAGRQARHERMHRARSQAFDKERLRCGALLRVVECGAFSGARTDVSIEPLASKLCVSA
jgi:hypothetical protein